MYRLHLIHHDRANLAGELAARLNSELRDLGTDPSRLDIVENQATDDSDTIVLALYLASAAGRGSDKCKQHIAELMGKSVPLVPLVDVGDTFVDVVPDALHPINALDTSSLTKVTAAVLRWLGLTEKHRRVFVSYRRSDSRIIGEQLWETLSKAGFDVFLDRFSIDPGVDFQERLTEALSDKAFLLLVESPDVKTSKWVEYEVEFARKTRMGILALTWPHSAKMKNVFDKQRRLLVDPSELADSPLGHQLSQNFLQELPDLVEHAHAKAMLARRRRMMGSLESELRRRNINYKLLSDWTLLAETHVTAGGQLFSITPRPPEIPDLFILDSHCGAAGAALAQGVLIHTAASMGEDRQQLLEWAIATRKLTLVNEDQIVQLVSSIVASSPAP